MTNTIPPEIIEQWRAEFEALLLCKHPKIEFGRFTGAAYWTPWINHLWQGFLLARQIVTIQLPAPIQFDDGHDEPSQHYWPTQIKAAIRAQGYQVREIVVGGGDEP